MTAISASERLWPARLDDLDTERFWADNAAALLDPFGPDIPQVPMGMGMGLFSAFAEIGLESDMKRIEEDDAFARQVAKAYNDRAEKIVGRRLIHEDIDYRYQFPPIKSVGELFGCQRIWQSESWWLTECAHTPTELERVLDRVEKLDLRTAMFPDNWESQCKRVTEATGKSRVLGKGLRGPVTLATSIYGVENLIYLILDHEALALRFRDVLLKVILEYFGICDQVSDPAGVRPGFSFLDDNCAMLTPEMYALFGQPILSAVYERFAPAPEHPRYQHSDSDMGHLLPLLAQTGMTRVNFGPRLTVREIRAAMPRAIIEGQLAPFTFMRNDLDAIVAEVRRDIDQARPTRGLVVATAGSVNDGTRLTSLRAVMHTIQHHGRYR